MWSLWIAVEWKRTALIILQYGWEWHEGEYTQYTFLIFEWTMTYKSCVNSGKCTFTLPFIHLTVAFIQSIQGICLIRWCIPWQSNPWSLGAASAVLYCLSHRNGNMMLIWILTLCSARNSGVSVHGALRTTSST